jgi:hypothetical protein
MSANKKHSYFVEQLSESILHSALASIHGRGFRVDGGKPTGKIYRIRHRPGQDEKQGVFVRLGPHMLQAHLKVVGPKGTEFWIRQTGLYDIKAGFLGKEIPLSDRAKEFCFSFLCGLSRVAKELKAGADIACLKFMDFDNDMPSDPPSNRALRIARIYLNHTNSTCEEVRNLRYLVNRAQEERKDRYEITKPSSEQGIDNDEE